MLLMREPMTGLNQFLAEIAGSGQIAGVSLAMLRAGRKDAEHYFGIRGAHDRAVVDAATVFEAASLTKAAEEEQRHAEHDSNVRKVEDARSQVSDSWLDAIS
ncbi:serine hydrolase [Paraburkholderia lacunae]|uniref:serine hydrolase n=1 Tax=Paraburkholderia lacunae TaxID=2211104 RepID=UPI0014027F8E|nr:serine hydrolase [Paraburkholderia lacunae]